MQSSREMLSVGIDVGTTTTQVAFSRLAVTDVARPGRVPRFNVTAKSLLYESPIQFTPLLRPDLVDTSALAALVRRAYAAAGLTPAQIETGAVIITGEIARVKNADEILTAVSQLAGDFVVTVAGPNVEAQIAGRGSGAAAYSADQFTQVTNVDIGGGTANAAIFRVGEYVASTATAVGGRQVVVDAATGIVQQIVPPGQAVIEATGLPIYIGQPVTLALLRRLADYLADLVVDLVLGIETELGRLLQLSDPFVVETAVASKQIFISGGVGTYYYQPIPLNSLSDVLRHGDIGPLLAQSLRHNPRLQKLPVARPAQTARATVMGASSQTVQLSGSTIWADATALPLRNLPVIRPRPANGQTTTPSVLAQAIHTAQQRWDDDQQAATYAIALDLPQHLDFRSLQAIAEGVAHYAQHLAPDVPLVLVTERDYALALGQTVKALAPTRPLITVDQVALTEADFIDIGKPILGGRVVPLSVKTLIFYQ